MDQYCVIENNRESNSYHGYLKVTGDFNFFVAIDIKRKPGMCNSNISLSAFSRSDRMIAIGVKYRWRQIDGQDKYDLNMTANFYQLSPRDIGRYIEIIVSGGHEDGFEGECRVLYGPITLDKSVEQRLKEMMAMRYLSLGCDGKTSRTSYRFDMIEVDPEEIQCVDKSNAGGNIVDTMRITKDLIIDPSQIDSLQMRVIAPGNRIAYLM